MPSVTASEIIIPKNLSAAERQQLSADLYVVHCQIFDGVERDSFAKYVVESKAEQTAIHIHKNAAGSVVGYCAIHIFEKQLHGRTVAVFRAEAGSLREYRGNNMNTAIAIKQFIRYRLAHPARPIFYLGTLVHPSSYIFCAKYADVVWPNREQPIAADIAAFMADLAVAFGLEAVVPQNPLVVHVGWRTRDTEAERNYWRGCDKPAARFFVQANPTYTEGSGLMTLVPVSGGGLLRSVGRFVAEQLRRRAEAARAVVYRLPLVGSRIGVGDIRRRLKHTPLFADVPDDDLTLAARAAEVITLPGGRYVLREGAPGDELYIIASGSVYALIERDGQQRVIDQLLTGQMFGEIAMLSGEPRSASIQTAAKTTLIRLKRAALLPLIDTHPHMREAIWGAFAIRRFEITAGDSTRFGALSSQQRRAWFAQGQIQQLAAQERVTISDPWLFVLTGTVEIQQNDTWLTTRAPALIKVTDSLQIVAQAPSRFVRMPQLE
jgi:CRP-like cAMP-binding protein